MGEYNARGVEVWWARTVKVYQEFHGRRAKGHLASPFGILIYIGERFILTLGELGGHNGKVFDDSAFTKGATVRRIGDEVLPVFVLGYDRGADGLRMVKDAVSGSEAATLMQRDGNSRCRIDRNGRCMDNKRDDGEQGGFGKHDEPGERGRGEILWN